MHREHRCTERDRILEGTQAPGTGIQSPYNEDTFGLDWSFYAQRGETPHLLGFAKHIYSIVQQRACVEGISSLCNVASFNAR